MNLLKHHGGYTHNVRNNSSFCLNVYISISYDSQRKEWFFLKYHSATHVGNVESVFCDATKVFLYHVALQMVKYVANWTEWCKSVCYFKTQPQTILFRNLQHF